MRRNKYSTIDRNFNGTPPSNNVGGQALSESSQQKTAAIQLAKKRAIQNANANHQNSENPVVNEDQIQAQEEPKTEITWNPNSKYSGAGRLIQHIKPLKNITDKFISMGNGYSDFVDYEEDEYGLLSFVSKAGSAVKSATTKVGSSISGAFKKTPLLMKPGLIPKKLPTSGIGSNSLLGNNKSIVGLKTGPLNQADQIVANNKSSIKTVGLPSTNTTGITTSAADRARNKANNISANTVSNGMNPIGAVKNVLNSKVKSMVAGTAIGATAASINGKNPVAGAVGGAGVGLGASYLAKNFSDNEYSEFLNNVPSLLGTELSLQRDSLLVSGFENELFIIGKTEAKERKIDKEYIEAKRKVEKYLSNQRDRVKNLKGNRGVLLKKLSNIKEEKMYSSLALLYYHCDR